MRLRTFTAATLSEAMGQVRQEMGTDAIILDTADAPDGGIAVRAACERGDAAREARPDARAALKAEWAAQGRWRDTGAERIARALVFHGVPERAAKALMDTVAAFEDDSEATATLSYALDARYGAHPIESRPDRALLFVGQPGAGKSATTAKAAARLKSGGVDPLIVSTDKGAGANARLRAYAEAVGAPFEAVDGPRELEAVARAAGETPLLVDTAGINPFDLYELDGLCELAAAADGEMVLVARAGDHPQDSEDAAALFASIGAGRLIVTQLDAARRLGALIAVGEAGLSYAHIAASPYIGSGLAPATALRLARALLDSAALDAEGRSAVSP